MDVNPKPDRTKEKELAVSAEIQHYCCYHRFTMFQIISAPELSLFQKLLRVKLNQSKNRKRMNNHNLNQKIEIIKRKLK